MRSAFCRLKVNSNSLSFNSFSACLLPVFSRPSRQDGLFRYVPFEQDEPFPLVRFPVFSRPIRQDQLSRRVHRLVSLRPFQLPTFSFQKQAFASLVRGQTHLVRQHLQGFQI